MQPQPLVSIILPTYNREKFLPRAINSVVNQTYQNWELIIVDDRSTDNTEALVREYMKQDQRMRYIKNTHKKGCGGSRNQGIEVAKGEYIAFLDDDDEWKEYHLKDIVEEFGKNEDVDWIYADIERVKDGEVVTKSSIKQLWKGRSKFITTKRGSLIILSKKNLLTNILKNEIIVAFQVPIIRKKVFDEMRFDESFFVVEDRLALLEAIAKGFTIAYIDKVHLRYTIHKDSLSRADSNRPLDKQIAVYRDLEKLFKLIPQKYI